MTEIIGQLNEIGDNPLLREEACALQRAYTAVVVKYFDDKKNGLLAPEDSGDQS
jgi:hypothetical protein